MKIITISIICKTKKEGKLKSEHMNNLNKNISILLKHEL
jgi:hypothetical protein